MRNGRIAFSLTAAAMVWGCGASTAGVNPSASNASPAAVSLVGGGYRALALAPLHALAARIKVTKGIYAGEYDNGEILGYAGTNPRNKPPICMFTAGDDVNGIAVDDKGNLIDPVGASRTIEVFKGPSMCGSELGSMADPYGEPSDATSFDAETGGIVVGNLFDGESGKSPGSVSICNLTTGCAQNLTNPDLNLVYAVAQAKNRDCWASGLTASNAAVLIYFKGCDSAGRRATHFLNGGPGGLDIDRDGNIVSIDYVGTGVYVYKGCDPRCVLVGGPFALHSPAVFGHLNARSTLFAAAGVSDSAIDVYSYSRARLTYEYSFENGLNGTYDVEGVAVVPRSRE